MEKEQNILKVKIFEGKYLSGIKIEGKGFNKNKDIIFEFKDGKGKEYYSNGKLKFEGKYFDFIRQNGKGYDINGNEELEIKNGTGYEKEYDEDDNLIIQGEFLNGKRNGKGKEYYHNGILLFKG